MAVKTYLIELENWLGNQADQLEIWLGKQSNLSENEKSEAVQNFLLVEIEELQGRGAIDKATVAELKWYFDLTEWHLA